MPAFERGDHCIVRGDSAHWGHRFPVGTEVMLLEPDGRYSWKCSPVEVYELTYWEEGVVTDTGPKSEDDWWVHVDDLISVDEGPDESEILRLFGVVPTPHCTTCTCYNHTEKS